MRPDEEGIKTRPTPILCAEPNGPALRPDEEGIKTLDSQHRLVLA